MEGKVNLTPTYKHLFASLLERDIAAGKRSLLNRFRHPWEDPQAIEDNSSGSHLDGGQLRWHMKKRALDLHTAKVS
jgi:hypothetical protein